jgi:DNA-binding NarL/FixJ family response regulator
VNRIRVLLAEDHETVRQGLKLLIDAQADMEVVGEAADGRVAVDRARALEPQVVVLDISMPEMNGLAATRALRQAIPGAAVVALTRHSDQAYVQELLGAGASAYVLKQSASGELLKAIRAAASGAHYLDSSLKDPRADSFALRRKRSAAPRVSDREREVLRLIALGHSNKDVAASLGITVKTVEVHKANAMRKLGLHGRIDVVRFALLQGWLKDS